MRTGKFFLVILFVIPLLVACGYQKTVSVSKSGNIKDLPVSVNQDQRLNAKEVQVLKRTRLLKPRSDQMEVIAASSSQKIVGSVDNEKTTNVAEKSQAKTTPNNARPMILIADTAAKAKIVYTTDALTKVSDSNDTTLNRPFKSLKVSTVMTQPAFTPGLAETYIRNYSYLKKFSVVVGSFSTLEKAYEEVLLMNKIDYKAIIIPNENGMYRVITGTFNDRGNAELHALALTLDSVKSWVLAK